ncbi:MULTISPECIES: hypothetical protein [unclassified Natrinema]|uniref:Transmembrane protein n=1 Tax=Saline Natrinema sp. J7-1 virus 2 TaxID=2847286 RepID=A0A976SFN1_9VIRU|nr:MULTISPECIES: hypothetical protein [unclassified Natrinema]YP_010772539.1 hypothetical protein QIT43_gp16 [Saline Natrinema sp. J7-1 virus 2]AFO55978.1 hypothetical protein NJ7G_0722 [Natrinema sp. J7-2]UUT36787.1 hypothetical protein SNJ2_gp16 [Saline Natrinema sp. J7-1 virus 2]
MIDPTDREKAIAACAVAVGIVAGMWVGLWLLPAEALNVPMDVTKRQGETYTSPEFRPVPSSFLIVTITAPALAIYYSYVKLSEFDDELGDQDETDDQLTEPIINE